MAKTKPIKTHNTVMNIKIPNKTSSLSILIKNAIDRTKIKAKPEESKLTIR